MQAPCYSLAKAAPFACRPSVGSLMALCEENYGLLVRLAPQIRNQQGTLVSRGKGGIDLHLIVEEQSRYTSVARLTHFFAVPDLPARGSDPDLRLRIYHDARQVEVLDLRQTALPVSWDYQHPALNAKWRVNLFLSKWLRYCLHDGHRFVPSRCELPLPEDGDLVYTCT